MKLTGYCKSAILKLKKIKSTFINRIYSFVHNHYAEVFKNNL